VITLVKKHINNASQLRPERTLHKLSSLRPRPVTAEEFCKVNYVTIREGVNHCRWPREVIAQFLVAEV
jgi:hypothetical protein